MELLLSPEELVYFVERTVNAVLENAKDRFLTVYADSPGAHIILFPSPAITLNDYVKKNCKVYAGVTTYFTQKHRACPNSMR